MPPNPFVRFASPAPPAILPLLLSVVTEHFAASTPSKPVTPLAPVMLPLVVVVRAPPSLKTGPIVAVEKVWSAPEHFASARSGAPKATEATSEALASNEARDIGMPQVSFKKFGRLRSCARSRPTLFSTPMSPLRAMSRTYIFQPLFTLLHFVRAAEELRRYVSQAAATARPPKAFRRRGRRSRVCVQL